jgi:hypothetical protein
MKFVGTFAVHSSMTELDSGHATWYDGTLLSVEEWESGRNGTFPAAERRQRNEAEPDARTTTDSSHVSLRCGAELRES